MTASSPDAAPRGVSVIRKYANRRLYDTTRARCVTLADIAERVRQGEGVRVIDARGGGDVTRQILAQIVCDAETSDDGILNEDVLTRLIQLSKRAEGKRVSAAVIHALDRLEKRTPDQRNSPANRAAAMLRPKGDAEARAVAARIDALEARLKMLIARADGTAKHPAKDA